MLANGKPELLVPASSLDVLKVAVMYGADASHKPKEGQDWVGGSGLLL